MNAGNEEEIKGMEEREDLKHRLFKRWLDECLLSPSFRAVMWSIIEDITGIWERSYTPDSPYHTAFMEGRRSVGQEIILLLQENDIQAYSLMMIEATKRREEEKLLEKLEEKETI